MQDLYRSYLYKKAEELNIEISQFGRLGKHMGVAKLNSEYRITNQNGLFSSVFLNLCATFRKLQQLQNIIQNGICIFFIPNHRKCCFLGDHIQFNKFNFMTSFLR